MSQASQPNLNYTNEQVSSKQQFDNRNENLKYFLISPTQRQNQNEKQDQFQQQQSHNQVLSNFEFLQVNEQLILSISNLIYVYFLEFVIIILLRIFYIPFLYFIIVVLPYPICILKTSKFQMEDLIYNQMKYRDIQTSIVAFYGMFVSED